MLLHNFSEQHQTGDSDDSQDIAFQEDIVEDTAYCGKDGSDNCDDIAIPHISEGERNHNALHTILGVHG